MLHVMMERGWINRDFIAAHTTGWGAVEAIVARYTPEYAAEIAGVPASMIVRAAEMWGPAETTAARVGAAALSLASTGALMILLKAAHPPAGATTLIISLGIVTRPFHLLVIEIAVAVLTLQAIVINRLAGIDYPIWALRDGPR
jgi:anaerobic selenocysteine-containing dehydrogenase